jgi:type I site-specific restriction endonuclease
MHCLLKSLSGGFAPPAALANFRSVFHSGLSLFKQLLFLHFELEFATLSDFPSPNELRKRLNDVTKLTPEQQAIVDVPYYSDAYSYEPRYYQRIAINRTIEAIAKGQQRVLIVMATGTGKTYTAFQIIHRLHKSGQEEEDSLSC